ncbi:MAG: LysR family transcriptional regulator [Hungatella sp.]|nr:LysR family transcriptional regulator [Hungatella sp.]MCI9502961.1 LysR family transcriptional regulator [Hungatella sp.]MCI9636027.1 LysR family transcriptional regulator [Hungatella sp.]
MEIRVLKYFLTVVREEGINRAAEVLHITQPTLSRQLSGLEEEIGVKLFERGARKITLTREGMLLRRRAEEILSLVQKTEEELTEQEELVDGKIVIGSGELAAVWILPDLIGAFSEKYPLVTFDLFTANADLVKEQMEKGLVDVGILLEPIDMEKFDFIRLHQKERWVVLMRPGDPLAEKEAVSAKDLEGRPLSLPRRTNVQNELASWFGDSFSKLRVLFTNNFTTNAAVMVQSGLTYAMAVEGSLPFWDKEKIISRPLYPDLSASSVLAWRKRQMFSPAVTRFIDHVKKNLDFRAGREAFTGWPR